MGVSLLRTAQSLLTGRTIHTRGSRLLVTVIVYVLFDFSLTVKAAPHACVILDIGKS